MSGFTKTTLIECPRSQSDEAIGNNNQNPSQWTNRCGDGLHLKPGDEISVHSSFVSEIGAEAGEIQIKGQNLNASKVVEITDFDNRLFNDELPQKYSLVNCSNKKQTINIRDDTLNLVVSPYKSTNCEFYAHLPRRWAANGSYLYWVQAIRRDGGSLTAGSRDQGQTQRPPPPLNVCKADLSTKLWTNGKGKTPDLSAVTGVNDGSRYTLFTRTQTFYGDPAAPTITIKGQTQAGSPVIQLTHGQTADQLIATMVLTTQTPDTVFATNSSILSVDSDTQITMSDNASANTNTHNLFSFRVPSSLSDQYLPPTTVNSSFTASQCEAHRDPATFGEYIQVKNLITLKANPGYNSPDDLADQLTQEINERDDLFPYQYNTSNSSNTIHRRETFTFKSETPAYRVYNCATAHNYQKSTFTEWFKTNGTWNINDAYHYLSSYQHIGIKRPELYTAGKLLNGPYDENNDEGGYQGLYTNKELPNGVGDKVFSSGLEWNKENLLRFKAFFDTQPIYPELFDYEQSGFECNSTFTRFFHMNLYDNENGSYKETEGNDPTIYVNYGTAIRDTRALALGYDLYNSVVNSNMTSFPIFVDYNPKSVDNTESDVGFTEWGNPFTDWYSSSLEPDFNDLAYGFGRKIRRVNQLGKEKFYIGFQFTRTGNKIPDHFFQSNASHAAGERTDPQYQLGSGFGRGFGFDYHFTAYGTAALMLYNGNPNLDGNDFTSLDRSASTFSQKSYFFGQSPGDRQYKLDNYMFGMYLGADNPQFKYDPDQQRFQLSNLHTAEVIGNIDKAGYNIDGTVQPNNPNATDPCYRINKRLNRDNYCPDMPPYTDNFTAKTTNGSANAYISHNPNVKPYTIMDAQSGLFIEDWVVPENNWDDSLVGIMGFRYDQFHNPNSTSSRQVRLKSEGANADLNNVNVITTNADVTAGDYVSFTRNMMNSNQITPVLPVNVVAGGNGFSATGFFGRRITPAVVISPARSVNITAQRLPTKTLRPYYTIRSDIISEQNQVLGGRTSGVTMPIVAITNKANPYGDFLNGFEGQITFTNTIDRVITRIKCSIHEPDGTAARCDLNSAVIFKVNQQVNTDLDLVDSLLQSKKKSDQMAAELAEDPELEFSNLKYTKDIFE